MNPGVHDTAPPTSVLPLQGILHARTALVTTWWGPHAAALPPQEVPGTFAVAQPATSGTQPAVHKVRVAYPIASVLGLSPLPLPVRIILAWCSLSVMLPSLAWPVPCNCL
jgi:hypothetical protein